MPAGGSCAHTVGTGYHSLGVVCVYTTTGFHNICDMKYGEHMGHDQELFYEWWHGGQSRFVFRKIEIYTVAEPVRSMGGSRWVWTSTVVIVHHN